MACPHGNLSMEVGNNIFLETDPPGAAKEDNLG